MLTIDMDKLPPSYGYKGILRRAPTSNTSEKSQRRVKFNNVVLCSPVSVADPIYEDISDLHEANDTSLLGALKRWNMKQTLLAWTSMILAVFAAASIGPAFKYMETHGIGPCLAASWRCQCMAIILVPIAILESRSHRRKRVDWWKVKPGLTFPVIVHLTFSGLAWSANLLSWIIGKESFPIFGLGLSVLSALQYTSTFKASLIASSHPILLVFLLRFKGVKVSYLEWIGVIVAFGGMVLSNSSDFFGPNAAATKQEAENHKYELIGFYLCFQAAVFEVLILFNRIATKKYVPLMQYTAGTTVVVAIMSSLASLALEGGNVLSSASAAHGGIHVFCQEENCIFGWTSSRWALKMMMFGLWVGVVCVAGFNYAMQYIPPLIFSSSALINPAVTAILSWLVGVEALPSLITWIGGFTVMTGVGVVTLGDHIRTEEEHKQAAAAAGQAGVPMMQDANDGENGMTLSVLHNGTAAGRSSSSSAHAGTKYSVLGTEDDEFGGDLELGLIADTLLGSPQSPAVSDVSGSSGGGDDSDPFGEEGGGGGLLSEEEERMLELIRNKAIAGSKMFSGGSSGNGDGGSFNS